jgi:hypothetical protein
LEDGVAGGESTGWLHAACVNFTCGAGLIVLTPEFVLLSRVQSRVLFEA